MDMHYFLNISGSYVAFNSIHKLKGGIRRQLYFLRTHEESWLTMIIMLCQYNKPLFQKMTKYNKILLWRNYHVKSIQYNTKLIYKNIFSMIMIWFLFCKAIFSVNVNVAQISKPQFLVILTQSLSQQCNLKKPKPL